MAKGGRESLLETKGLVMAAQSWPSFQDRKKYLRRCCKNLGGQNFALKLKLWPPNFLQHRPNFAGNWRLTGIFQLRGGTTLSKNVSTPLSYRYCESWVLKDSVSTCPEIFSCWKFTVTERFTKNFHFSRISIATWKKVAPCCEVTFDATDLPHS